MPSAEMIAIGTELLLGEIQETNTRYIARFLRDLGIDFYRSTMIGDNEERIAQAMREAMGRCQIIITTGGLGPTVDDPTRQAVARALGVELECRPELWEQILARFKRYNRQASENNRKQDYIPAGTIPMENPVGTAPCFIAETPACCIISLPGVPREMEYLIENKVTAYLRQRFNLRGTIKARVLHVAGVGESTVDEWVADLEKLSNPSVGLLAHPGMVDIRITAKAESIEEADRLISEMEGEVRRRVPEGLFGADKDTIEQILMQRLQAHGWSLAVIECSLGGNLSGRLAGMGLPAEMSLSKPSPCSLDDLHREADQFRQKAKADAVLAVSLNQEPERHVLNVIIITPQGEQEHMRSFGGERALSNPWSVNTGLELLRRAVG